MPDFVRHFNSFLALDKIQQNDPQRFPLLLQSVAKGHDSSRYDILLVCDDKKQQLCLDNFVLQKPEGINIDDQQDFLKAFDLWFKQLQRDCKQQQANESELPFTGGWAVYLGYELAAQIEPVLAHMHTNLDWPQAVAIRTPAALINDKLKKRSTLVIESEYKHLQGFLLQALIFTEAVSSNKNDTVTLPKPTDVIEQSADGYLQAIEAIKHYIRAGDVFQVNLSRKWLLQYQQVIDATDCYQRLCAANPAPFAGLFYWREHQAIVSSSPERLVQVKGRLIQTRPIAGTYPRSNDQSLDQAWSAELLAHPKERAEHIMLIDLERNDMGRICQPGSIQVSALMSIESYAHVHHIVSNIQGELAADVSPGQILRAVFPGGTITGCPKVRCMEIIDELEKQGRGFYTGSFGYINRNGDMDMNILIRTMGIRNNQIMFRAGAGIVYDSLPARELKETRAKAHGLLCALGV